MINNLDKKIEEWAKNNDKIIKINKVKLYLAELSKKNIDYILKVFKTCEKYNLNFLLKDLPFKYDLSSRNIYFIHHLNLQEIMLVMAKNAANLVIVVEDIDPGTMITMRTNLFPIDEKDYYKIFDFINDIYQNFDNMIDKIFIEIEQYINKGE